MLAFLGLLVILVMLMTSGGTVTADQPPDPGVRTQEALGSAFTYQGYLKQGGNAVTGTCDIRFILYDGEIGGSQIGSTETKTDVAVSNGLFTAQPDFGASAFSGQARWLEIGVRCPAGSGTYSTLSPRQALTATPYALYATTAATATTATTATTAITATNATTATTATSAPWSGLTGVPAGFADGVDNDSGGDITALTASSGLSGGGASGDVTLAVSFGGGGSATTAARSDHGHDASYWSLTGNSGTISGTNFLGTTDNVTLTLAVSGTAALRLEPNTTSPNLLGGYSGNSVTSGAVGATIGGGGASGNTNSVTDDYGTVGGGRKNRAGDNAGTTSDRIYATVGGGSSNTASGFEATVAGGLSNVASGLGATVGGGAFNEASNNSSTVGGGSSNTASGTQSTVAGGGSGNRASGNQSTVGGGAANMASGDSATVPGGISNTAAGDYSVAAGRRAIIDAAHDGSFLFADGSNFDFASTAANQFAVRSTGGARFVSAIDGSGAATAGVTLAAGDGSWANASDRALKANFAPVGGADVLKKVLALPITTWNYQAQDPSIRHMGPVAQDFHAAFGLGEDDRHITTVDADGVALAAIQGLYEALLERDARISQLEARLAALEAHLGGGGQ